MRYIKILNIYFSNSLQSIIAHPAAFWIFFISKSIRYGLFFMFLYFLSSSIGSVGGYTASQMLIFYLVFNLVDTTSQMLFREVYRFRPLVVSGGFDGVLAKPFPPLLRVLIGGPDYIDLSILA
ncbi:MAG: ABC-2 family transporter protein, partial [Patescibacteria group bacterium]